MEYLFIFVFGLLIFTASVSAHEPQVLPITGASDTRTANRTQAVDIVFHAIVFGGLIAAGVNGAIQNKKTTGKYIVL